jgi:hypothetical protein
MTAVDALPTEPSKRVPGTTLRDFNPCPGCRTVSAANRSQGLAFEFGRGRVVVIGEMGMLVAFSVPATDNRQLAINVVRWLAKEL